MIMVGLSGVVHAECCDFHASYPTVALLADANLPGITRKPLKTLGCLKVRLTALSVRV